MNFKTSCHQKLSSTSKFMFLHLKSKFPDYLIWVSHHLFSTFSCTQKLFWAYKWAEINIFETVVKHLVWIKPKLFILIDLNFDQLKLSLISTFLEKMTEFLLSGGNFRYWDYLSKFHLYIFTTFEAYRNSYLYSHVIVFRLYLYSLYGIVYTVMIKKS